MDYRGWPKEAVAWLRSGNLTRSRRRRVSRLTALLHGECLPIPNPSNIIHGIRALQRQGQVPGRAVGHYGGFRVAEDALSEPFQGGVRKRFSRGGMLAYSRLATLEACLWRWSARPVLAAGFAHVAVASRWLEHRDSS
eukprot:9492562-Pyramimonas_sp.AAC.1